VRELFRVHAVRQENGSKNKILRTRHEARVQTVLREVSARIEETTQCAIFKRSQEQDGGRVGEEEEKGFK